jgi:3-isopropylmalate/(R)-2-methylmalate dehydratase large subunit
MGETVIEKIIRNNVGKTVKPGDIVTVNVDRVMIHDIFIPFVAEKFEEMGFTKLWDPDKVVLIYDHLVPASQLDDTRHFHAGDAFAKKYGMKNVHRSDGICHQLMTEAGYVKPGNIVFGTDSHTTTYGWCIFFRYRIYRNGKYPGNRNDVDQGSGDHQSSS